VSQLLDLGSQLLLAVDPGAADASFAGKGLDGDGLSGVVHAAQGGEGSTVGGVGAPACCGNDVVGVVSPHRAAPGWVGCPRRTR
jgi:hypothetical protein